MNANYRYKLPDGRVVGGDSPEYLEYLDALVEKAPPFTAEQRADLWVLLAPMREELRRRAEARLAALDAEGAAA